jgi:hypothetical protein
MTVRSKAQAKKRLKEAKQKVMDVIMWWPTQNAQGDRLFKVMKELDRAKESLK